MRLSRFFCAIALSFSTLFAVSAASAQQAKFQPSNTFWSEQFVLGKNVFVSDQLALWPGFAVNTDGLPEKLAKLKNVTPVVHFVRVPTGVKITQAQLVDTIVKRAVNPRMPKDTLLLAIGRGPGDDGNANAWVIGIRVGPALSKWLADPDNDADVQKIISEEASRSKIQDSDKAKIVEFAATVESRVAALIAHRGGPGHTSFPWLAVLILIGAGVGGWYYVTRTNYPIPGIRPYSGWPLPRREG